MSIAVMSRLFKARIGSPSRKILALRLADFADDEGRGIWPTVGRLANETELHERTVQRLLKEFVEEGLLVVVAEGGGRPGQATRYDFDLLKLEALVKGKIVSNGCHHDTGVTMSPVSPDAETGDIDDREGCHHATQTVIEPLNKPSTERARENEQESRENRKANELAFKKANRSWPTALTDSEPDAFRAWNKLSMTDRKLAHDEAERYLAAARSVGRTKICSHAVYLREKRWEKLTARDEAAVNSPAQAKPFGKMWAARVYELFLTGPTKAAQLSALEQKMVDAGTFTAERLLTENQVKYGFPAVNELFDRAAGGRGALVPIYLQAISERMVAVKVGGELWQAWIDEHATRGWPWLPKTGSLEYVYLPEGGPQVLNYLHDLLRGIEK